ncbi:hypothetical protein L3Q82_017592 [Scortum barcoo]|uniref:Uncharacterized protein n=1 Tax=Scortum barcoo TaxID=214431 RepID=A0ACB8VLJ2_9TELE|nr:hypothetical protein L3Q82_017592 [Scortum barcoo]
MKSENKLIHEAGSTPAKGVMKKPFYSFALLCFHPVAGAGTAPSKSSIAVPSSKAQEFLAKLSRTKRNVWDRSRPDVQQWIMQFMYMGFDEQRLETDLSYWMDLARSSDQGRQHHYDENAPIGPRDPSSYRHGANVNYDYY